MPRLAANLTLLFADLPLPERFAAARRAGFRGVEIQLPYALPADEIARLLADAGLELVLHNLPCGDWAGGDRGIACLPGREAEFRDGVALALDYARRLGCRRLNCLAGIAPAEADPAAVRATMLANLRHAAERCAEHGVMLLVEPVNTRDTPGFYLHGSAQALALLDEVGAPGAMLQYDAYHMQMMEGDLARTIAANIARIGHVQIADNPGRHEPGTGEINFDFLLEHLDSLGYRGWVGCEWVPRGDTAAGLDSVRRWLI